MNIENDQRKVSSKDRRVVRIFPPPFVEAGRRLQEDVLQKKVQGWPKRWTPGCVNMSLKSCVLPPAAGRRTQLFLLIFTEPGVHLLGHPCNSVQSSRRVVSGGGLALEKLLFTITMIVFASFSEGGRNMNGFPRQSRAACQSAQEWNIFKDAISISVLTG